MRGVWDDVRTYWMDGERFFIPDLSFEGVEINIEYIKKISRPYI